MYRDLTQKPCPLTFLLLTILDTEKTQSSAGITSVAVTHLAPVVFLPTSAAYFYLQMPVLL